MADKTGIKMGMWLFLYTEIMLFGGLFLLYAAYYHRYSLDFAMSGRELNTLVGTCNTLLLLLSSFMVASSLTTLRRGQKQQTLLLICGACILGIIFLINKYFEWSHKFSLGIYPNSAELVNGPHGRNIFFSLYYLITGLHGIHVLIGLILLMICTFKIQANKITPQRFTLLDNCGLYWHLVDLIWIFVFPLFYLIL